MRSTRKVGASDSDGKCVFLTSWMLQDFWTRKRELRPPRHCREGQDLLSRVTGLGGPAPWSSVYLMALFLETRTTRPNRKATDREQINSECLKNTKGRRRRKRKKKGSTDDKPKKNEKRPCENLRGGGNESIDQKKLTKERNQGENILAQDSWFGGQVYPMLSHKGYLKDLREERGQQ